MMVGPSFWRGAQVWAAFVTGALLAVPQASATGCLWVVGGSWRLDQTNGFSVGLELKQNNGEFTGRASLYRGGNLRDGINTGEVRGNVDGNVVSFIIAWADGAKGEYRGTIEIDGRVSGSTVDVRNPQSTASWNAAGLSCVAIEEPTTSTPESAPPKPVRALGKKKPPAPVQLPQPAQKMATAIDDVDIYKGPGPQFEQLEGFLRAGTTVPVLGYHEDGWYQLKLDVPGGSGWVAADHLTVGP